MKRIEATVHPEAAAMPHPPARAHAGPAAAPAPRAGEGPAAAYARLQDEHGRGLAAARRAGDRFVRARTAVLLAAVAGLVLWDFAGRPLGGPTLAAAAIVAAVFAVLVALHRRARRAEAHHHVRLDLAEEGLARLARDWERLPPGAPAPPEVGGARRDPAGRWPADPHPYANDLQLFGRVSLAALAGPLTTALGERTLAGWLLAPAEPAEVVERQAAAREVAPALDVRQALAALGRDGQRPSLRRTEALLTWAGTPPWLPGGRWAAAAAWILPALTWTLIVLHARGLAGALWAAPLLVQLAVHLRLTGRMRDTFARAEVGAPEIARYAEQIALVRSFPADSPRLGALVRRLSGDGDGEPGDERLRALARSVGSAETRRNVFYRLMSPFFLLDLHVHLGLERWKGASGAELAGWLEALGEVEALCALATLAHDHPGWAWPAFDAEPSVRAQRLAHPLLPPERAVGNDVEVGPPGKFLFVTGSNMSGKSTLLRALGANAVLASAGAPVCAEALRLPPLSLQTSIRVQDSLEEGVSFFMAELLALARIVEAAQATGAPAGSHGSGRVLYLVDEMLQGTNSADRRVAARTILARLLASGALGAITTHDLALIASPELEAAAVAVHFRETATGVAGSPRLDFDYRLRPGPATTRNALKLLELVGLGETAPRAPRPAGRDGSADA